MVTPEECDLYFYEKRLQTYSGWPFTGGCACTPENMAKAGFIHCPTENSPDVVQCFFCYKELEGWEPEDDPLQEHKRHSPNCTFIGLKKSVEDMTLVELLKLQKDRQKFLLKKSTDETMEKFRQAAQNTRSELVKIITKAN